MSQKCWQGRAWSRGDGRQDGPNRRKSGHEGMGLGAGERRGCRRAPVVRLGLAAGEEVADDRRRAERVHPAQLAVRVALVEKGLERGDALQHLARQVELVRLVRRPEAGRQHLRETNG
eukprot:4333694-Pleurochrysis_carterae.AAC.2